MSISDKLQKIQLELKVHKGQRNSFGKYNYRSAEDILEAIKPLQKKHGVVFQISESLRTQDGLAWIESDARITDLEDNGCYLTSSAMAVIDFDAKGMQMPQRTGSASSYAKKYALGNLLLIDDTKDSDATNEHDKGSSDLPQLKIGTPDFKKVKDAIKNGKATIDYAKSRYQISDAVLKHLQ